MMTWNGPWPLIISGIYQQLLAGSYWNRKVSNLAFSPAQPGWDQRITACKCCILYGYKSIDGYLKIHSNHLKNYQYIKHCYPGNLSTDS